MNLRWLFGNFTDPQYKLSVREQFRLSNVAHAKFLPRGAFVLRTVIITLPVLLGFLILKPFLELLGYSGSNTMLVGIYAIVFLTWP